MGSRTAPVWRYSHLGLRQLRADYVTDDQLAVVSMNCRNFPNYPHCACDPVSCVMLRSTANPAGLESMNVGSLGSEPDAVILDRIARALHEAHKPFCDHTYPFEHPMASRHVYETLARAAWDAGR